MSSHKPMLRIYNPANGQLLTELETDDSMSIIEKYNRSMAAQLDWIESVGADREAIIRNFADLLDSEAEHLACNLAEESGKLIADCRAEIAQSALAARFYLANWQTALRTQKPIDRRGHQEQLSYDPLGVIALIAGLDLPVLTATNVIVPALLAGNTVLYKPGVYTTLASLSLVDLFYQAGLHDELLIPVLGDAFAGQELLKWPVNGVFFSGSAANGQMIADLCARRLCPLQMELHANNAVYICADADLPMAASQIGRAIIYHSGQSRICVKRVYVEAAAAPEFTQLLQSFLQQLQAGSPLDPQAGLGPLNLRRDLDGLLQSAQAEGARVWQSHPELPGEGYFYSPTLLIEAQSGMDFLDQDLRGPIASIIPVMTDVEAIHGINDSRFGFCASVYTPDSQRARRILGQTQTGVVMHNQVMQLSPYLPCSPRKEAGLGLTGGLAGIRSFTRPRAWFMQ
ncbi:MAG: aldehyde dehydrogenase family protein [Leptospiraceae bacterium]|nr:aldehyde dehydrogenase family protein [Leptospiraceae bacterium]